MKKLMVFLFLFGLLGCTIKDDEIIKLLNSLKSQNDELLLQLNSVKKTTDSAFVAVSKINSNQTLSDTKIEAVKLELQKVLVQIANLNIEITKNSSNVYELKAKVDFLQQKCAELVLQIAQLSKLSQSFTLKVDFSPINSGTVQISPQSDTYSYGTEITLTIAPSSAYSFKQWSGDTTATTNPLKIKITKNLNISAVLENINTLAVKDVDGNTYNSVKIGNQIWMKENLNVTKYQNGDVITNELGNEAWASIKTPAWCRYNNEKDITNPLKVGLLYNGYVAIDKRNVCPTGWRVPLDSDFQELITFLGGVSAAGGKLKEANGTSSLWNSPNSGATNSSGFTALPAGYRHSGVPGNWINGLYEWALLNTYYWTSTSSLGGGNITYQLQYNNSDLNRVINNLNAGQSIRCIKN